MINPEKLNMTDYTFESGSYAVRSLKIRIIPSCHDKNKYPFHFANTTV